MGVLGLRRAPGRIAAGVFGMLFDLSVERLDPCPFPTLEGARVRLRPLVAGDIEDLIALRGDPETARYQSWSRFDAVAAEAMIADARRSRVDQPGVWAQGVIARRADDRLIGDLAIHCPREAPEQSELGFNLMTAERGRGFATEAVGLAVEWLLGERRKRRVFAVTDRRNQPSRRLLERVGFRAVPEAYRIVFFKRVWEGETVYERLAPLPQRTK